MTVHNPRFYRRTVFGGALGFAESYLQGEWSTDDLTAVLQFFAGNMSQSKRADGTLSRFGRWVARMGHQFAKNTKLGSRKNISAHYDLGNDFFQTFLDDTMMYSSGIFADENVTLHAASVEKLDRICRKLDLQSTDHVIEIGTGWGGFALHAASQYGCRVTTTTISREQYEMATKRVQEAGLEDRITVLMEDYRDLTGQYDKLVSIEMIEAVGHEFLDGYFEKCSQLLKPNGMLAIQAITIPHQRYDSYIKSVDFIQKYIFPGGCLPSVTRMNDVLGRRTDLQIAEIADFSEHYAKTLALWKKRFFQRLDEVQKLGYDERFLRLWEYYLSYCEAAFRDRLTGVVQLFAAKPDCRIEPSTIH
jgi:cyclopropane-fatty-acyl-phospholipid synthase